MGSGYETTMVAGLVGVVVVVLVVVGVGVLCWWW